MASSSYISLKVQEFTDGLSLFLHLNFSVKAEQKEKKLIKVALKFK